MKRFAWVLFFLSNTLFCVAQFSVYNTSNSPLPDDNVFCIAVDSLNRKWIGTENGLAVFDNTNWIIYNTSNSGLLINSIRAINFDLVGNAWIGTYFGGMVKFDGAIWTVFTTSNSQLPGDFVKTIDVDSSGNIWMGTDNGFAKFDGASSWTVWNSSNSVFVSDNIRAIRVNRKRDFKYIGTVNGGYAQLDSLNNITIYTTWNSSIADNTTIAIELDSSGYQYLGFPANGFMIHTGGNTWFGFNPATSPLPSYTVNDIYVDNVNSRYFATLGGLAKLSNTSTWSVWDTANSNLPDNFLQAVKKDTGGIVWAGTIQGVVRLDETVSTAEINKPSFVSIYPNPAKDALYLSGIKKDAKSFTISDITGKIRLQKNISSVNSVEDVHFLSPGIYFLRIFSPGGVATKKFVKTN